MNYEVLGVDGKWYGPIDITGLATWVAEGRIVANTKIREVTSTIHFPARDLPNLGIGDPHVQSNRCSHCGTVMYDRLADCSNCGSPATQNSGVRDKSSYSVGMAVGAICGLIFCLGWIVFAIIDATSAKTDKRFNAGLRVGFMVVLAVGFAFIFGFRVFSTLLGFPFHGRF
ncbi:MAG: hypothetical protein ABJA67_12775 [Chthonomonadales bacterium]